MLKKKVLLTLNNDSLNEQLSIALEGLFDLRVDAVLPVSSVLRSLDRSQYVGFITPGDNAENPIYEDLAGLGTELVYEAKSGIKGLILKAYSAFAGLYRQDEEYCPFPLLQLGALAEVLGTHPELFLKLPSERLVKIHPGGEIFEDERAHEYRDRGVTTLYVPKAVFFDYLNRRYEFIAQQISHISSGDVVNQRELTLQVHQQMVASIRLSLGSELGIPGSILEAASTLVGQLLQQEAFEKPWFDRLSKSLESGHYIENLALLTGHFACWILNYSSYNERKWHERMMMAAIVMDLALQDEKVARIRQVHEGATTVGMLQAMMIKAHPQKALELVSGQYQFGSEVEQMVLQHHERFDGSGFPRKLYIGQIAPLSRLFVLAHMFADKWLENPQPEPFKSYLSELQDDPALKVISTLLRDLKQSL